MKKLILAGLIACITSSVYAQSSPNWTYKYVPTTAEWNNQFAKKQDYLGSPPCLVGGCSMTGPLITTGSTLANAGFKISTGVAPSSPGDGDMWLTASGLFVRVNGSTVGPLTGGASASFAGTSPIGVTFPAGVVTYAFDFTVANTFLAQQIDQGATTTSPGWFVQIAGDTVPRARLGMNATDIPGLALGPGNATRDTFLERAAAATLRHGGPDAAAPVAQNVVVQNVVAGTSNTAGAALTISGSRSTGSAAGGSIILQTSPLGGSGSSQNALVNALTVFGSGGVNIGAPTGGDKGAGTLNAATNLYINNTAVLTGNQTITLSGDATGTGSTSITVTNVNLPTGVTVAGNLLHTNIAAPSTPASGKVIVWTDSSDLRFHDKDSSGNIGTTVRAVSALSHNFLTAISPSGVASQAQPAFSDISGTLGLGAGGTGQTTAILARQSSGLNVYGDSGTGHGDTIVTIGATERFSYTTAAFTASRAWTLPAANVTGAPYAVKIADMAGGVTGVNTLVITRAGSDTINGGTTATIAAANGGYECTSDGTSKWTCQSTGAASAGGVSGVTIAAGIGITVSGTCTITTNGTCTITGPVGHHQEFSASGTFTTPVAASTTTVYHIRMAGPGGGGQGGGSSNAIGSAGGSGGYTEFWCTGVAANTGISITIGTGGSAGAASSGSGGAGSGSSSYVCNGTTVTAGAGSGGAGGAGAGGAGGTATNGHINIVGGNGTGGGTAVNTNSVPINIGGSNPLGFGGLTNTSTGAGAAGTGCGSGGSAGWGAASTGGAGNNGCAYIDWVL